MQKNVSSEELTIEAIEKIEKIDHAGYELRSVLEISPSALSDAREYDKKQQDLPLAGIPILIKNNIEVKGLKLSAGSQALSDDTVTHDATLVKHLLQDYKGATSVLTRGHGSVQIEHRGDMKRRYQKECQRWPHQHLILREVLVIGQKL